MSENNTYRQSIAEAKTVASLKCLTAAWIPKEEASFQLTFHLLYTLSYHLQGTHCKGNGGRVFRVPSEIPVTLLPQGILSAS